MCSQINKRAKKISVPGIGDDTSFMLTPVLQGRVQWSSVPGFEVWDVYPASPTNENAPQQPMTRHANIILPEAGQEMPPLESVRQYPRAFSWSPSEPLKCDKDDLAELLLESLFCTVEFSKVPICCWLKHVEPDYQATHLNMKIRSGPVEWVPCNPAFYAPQVRRCPADLTTLRDLYI